MATTPTGTFTKKIHRQPSPLGERPPDERSDGDRPADHRAVDAEGGPSLFALEGRRDEGQ